MTSGTLYDHPDLYDLVMGANPAAEAFYAREARQRGSSVLALACGTGRYAIPLARSELRVVGGDLSHSMLEHARAKAALEGVHLQFLEMDMRDFCLPDHQFNLVVIAGNALLHLHKSDEVRSCFRALAQHLAPGGALAFDIFVPSMRLLARDPGQRHLVGTFKHGTLGELTLEETVNYDAASQTNRGTWFWSTSNCKDFVVIPLHLRQLFPQELPLLIELGGFRLRERFGDFDRSVFSGESRRQVCVCEVA
jgi:SAM-dependent methyltransferase